MNSIAASLTITRPSLPAVVCTYVSDGSNTYGFSQCGQGFLAFQSIEAESVTLRVNDGDSGAGPTVVRAELEEVEPCDGECPSNIDDGDPCTLDECTTEGGITHSPIAVDDGNPRTIEVCLPTTGLITWLAPALDPSGTTTVRDAWSFLYDYDGQDPIQTGVDPDDIDAVAAALIEGYVFLPNGDPARLATVKVLNRPDFGSTVTDHNGRYLMVVNGGNTLTVDIELGGYLPVQRPADPPWQGKARVDDVVLVDPGPPDGAAEIDADAIQVISDTSVESDDRGERQVKVLVQPETTASMEFANGTLAPLEDNLTLTIKEYTVGDDGPTRMPAALPASSAYTYAVEIRAAEAEAAGATGVKLDTPLHVYLKNFLGFPVGTIVPVGRYDRQRGVWTPEEDGLVIGIVAIDGSGAATLDLDGDGLAESEADVEQVGFDDDTRLELGDYGAGETLWHVRLDHLSPCDFNLPLITPNPCSPAECGTPPERPDDDPDGCEAQGSRIECSHQIRGESLPLSGTPYSLAYSSDRVPGRIRPQRRVELPLTGADPPTALRFVEAQVDVAGRTFKTRLDCPPTGCEANTVWDFNEWDGRDLLGRSVQGGQPSVFKVTYGIAAEYADPGAASAFPGEALVSSGYAFGRWGSGVSLSVESTPILRLTSAWDMVLGTFDARSEGLGGFTFDAVHHYDLHSRTLFLGNGQRRKIAADARLVVRKSADHIPSNSTGWVLDMVAEEDGSLLVLAVTDKNHPDSKLLYRRHRDGTTTTLAGGLVPCAPYCDIGDRIARDPNGIVYLLSFYPGYKVSRLVPGGTLEHFAGTGAVASDGDGGQATSASLYFPSAVAADRDGNVFIAEAGRIRRVDANGRIETVASGTALPGAVTAPFSSIHDLEVGADGALYVLASTTILRIDATGEVSVVAGGGSDLLGDGVDATTAVFSFGVDDKFTIGRDGTIDLTASGPRIRRISPDGTIRSITGKHHVSPELPPLGVLGIGGPAARATYDSDPIYQHLKAIARTPDGRLHSTVHWPLPTSGLLHPRGLIAIEPELPGSANELTQEIAIASDDGTEVYIFDPVGRHLTTKDARFGNVILSIGRDAEGRIVTLADESNLVTSVMRDGRGNPTAIEGPFGHTTNVVVNGDGYLETAEDPLGEAYQMTYQSGGLMKTWSNRNDHGTEFWWDADGRLIQHENEAGGIMSLTEISSTKVERKTPLQRVSTYERAENPAGVIHRESTFPSLLAATREQTPAGQSTTELPDGTVITTQLDGDPRFAMQAPVISKHTTSLPSGLTRVVERSRSVTLSNPGDWFSLTSSVDQVEVAGRTWQTSYNASTRTQIDLTPELRTRTTVYDVAGRPTQVTIPGVHPTSFEYDAYGRLWKITQGSRVTTRSYGNDGLVSGITNALNQTTSFGRNDRGDVVLETPPDNEAIAFGYDAEQHLSSVDPSGNPAHALVYGELGRLETYDPPDLSGTGPWHTTYTYDLDKKLDLVDPPGAHLLDYAYDAAGRLHTVTFPGGQTERVYSGTTGHLTDLLGPYGVDLVFGYDGKLSTSVAWSGDVNGTVAFGYDDSFRIATETINGAYSTTFGYDDDSLLIQAGSLSLERDAASGRLQMKRPSPTGYRVEEGFYFTSYGELWWSSAVYEGADTIQLLQREYTRDDLGRIVQVKEWVEGEPATWYVREYTPAGRLEKVIRHDGVPANGVFIENYEYDADGNRIWTFNSAGSFVAEFDDQDRISTYGDLEYEWTLNGELSIKRDTVTGDETEYTYDALGNLLAVALPNGDYIEYLVDGMGRRVGKKVNGTVTKKWLWRNQLQPVAELDANDNVVARYVYADGVNVPDQIVTATATYRLLKDQVGSVRLVVDEATGTVVQRIDYDSWGRVLLNETAPGFDQHFQPFGFAGGLHDPDTGLVRLGARDYDPEIGRWTSKDPIRFDGGINLFEYSKSDPVNFVDPTGRNPLTLPALLGGGLAQVAGTAALVTAAVLVGAAVVDDAAELPPISLPPFSPGGLEPLPDVSGIFGAMAAAAATSTAADDAGTCDDGDDDDHCGEHLKRCNMSKLGNTGSGGKYGYSQCRDCWLKCTGQGGWPIRTNNGKSCNYGLHR